MTITLDTPEVHHLTDVEAVLREWQDDAAPLRLHPGDLGWFWRFGATATAGAVRTWRQAGRIVAVGLLDGPDLLRLTTAPDTERDEDLARRLADDLVEHVLPAGPASVETPTGALVADLLGDRGWAEGERWTPLHRDLAEPVPDPGVRIATIGPEHADERAAVHRASFDRATFTADAWHAMAAAPPYRDARCLIAYDERDVAVAAVTVWSAGPGRPGVLEPMGVHRDHRGRGYGTAVSLAAARALRDLGSSSALVCTPSDNAGAVATYASAGFVPRPERRDRVRR